MWPFWVMAIPALAFGFVVFWGAPYVPSKKKDLSEALDQLYPLGKKDVLIDVGSGDGVVLRAAATRGAKAIGYELNPLLVLISRWLCRKQQGISVEVANFWHVSLPAETTIIYAFVVSRDSGKLVRKINEEATRLGRPLLLISYGCELPEKAPVKMLGAHALYEFAPLHTSKA